MKLLLLDGINNISVLTTFNKKYNLDESFLLLASILKYNQLTVDFMDLTNDAFKSWHILKSKKYDFIIFNTNKNNFHIVKNFAKRFNIEKIIFVSFDMDFSSIFQNHSQFFYIYFGDYKKIGLDKLFSILNISNYHTNNERIDFSLVSDLSDKNVSLNVHSVFNHNGIKHKKDILFISLEIEDILKMGVKSFHINDLFIDFDYYYIIDFCLSVNRLREKYDFFYSSEINFPIKNKIDILLIKSLYDSGLQRIVISIIDIDNNEKDTIIEKVKELIINDIVNIKFEITQKPDLINQIDIYQNFIMDLINCSNGLIDFTFKKDEISTNIESLLNFNDFCSTIEYDNWTINMAKKIQSEQKKLYCKISLKHRHQIVLLSKYGIISQLYISTVHKSHSVKFLNNRFIYFSYQINESLFDYTPIVFAKIYFDNLKNTHIISDTGFYIDRNELVYNEKFYKFFLLLQNMLPIKEAIKQLDKNEEEIFTNLIKELEYNNCLYFVKYLM